MILSGTLCYPSAWPWPTRVDALAEPAGRCNPFPISARLSQEETVSAFYQHTITAQLDRIERLARARFESLDPAVVDEAVNDVLDALTANDYARLRAFNGGAKLTTYLTVVITRQLEDFARRKFGANRLPTWISQQGLLYKTLYKLLCWQRQPRHSAVAIAANLLGSTDSTEIEQAARDILGRYPQCGQSFGPVPCDLENLPDPPATATCQPLAEDPEQAADASHGGGARLASALLIDEPGQERPVANDHAPLIERLRLSPTQRWILTLEFRYGLSVTQAAHRLGLTVHQAHGLRRRAFERIQQAMRDNGIDPDLEFLS